MFSRQFVLDLLERTLSTFAQALLGAGTVIDFGNADTYKIAGVAAAVAALKCLAATRTGAPNSGSLLPAKDDPPAAD